MAIFRGIGGAGDSTTDATLTAVTQQATNAASSATAASSSASAAASSASSADTSASSASSFEASVSADATSAASSATLATASKVAAAASETAAAASETAAGASETAAAASESAAATSASNAASSASSAVTSASTATTQASLATSNGAAQVALATTQAGLATTNGEAQVALATTQATNSASSASTATTKAGEAVTSASDAATSATASASSASASAASADAALTALDNFDDRYLGQKASDPTVDNDGNALVAGALYFNTTDSVMKVYEGSVWVAAYASLSGALIATNNLSDLVSVTGARTNLGLGTAATTAATDYATAAQGALADSALQAADVGTAAAQNVGYFATAAQGTLADSATQPADLATVATSGGYADLTGKPTLGTAAATASTDYATAAQGATADTAVQPNDTVSFAGLTYTGTLTGGTGVVNIGSGQVYKDASGNLGIATTSPVEQLTIGGNGSQGRIGFNTTGVDHPYMQMTQYGSPNTSVTVRIDSDGNSYFNGGNVGIGTSTTNQRLNVFGPSVVQVLHNTDATSNDSHAAKITTFDSGAAYWNYLNLEASSFRFSGYGTERMRIDGAGNVGIGTTPSYKLHVNGDIYATGNVTAYSDIKLKTNIRTIEGALDLVGKMRGVRYDRIDTGEASVGVIAQEMREVLPEVVTEKDGAIGVAYGNISGVLIEAINELRAEVTELRAELKALKGV